MRSGSLRLHGSDFSRLQRILDPLLVTGLFLALVKSDPASSASRPLAFIFVAGLTSALLSSAGVYSSYRIRSLGRLSRLVTRAWLLVLLSLLSLAFLSKTTADYSRLSLSAWASLSWLLLLLSHVGSRSLLRYHRSQGGNLRYLVYWGLANSALTIAKQLNDNPWMGLRLVGYFGPTPPATDQARFDYPSYLGGLEEMHVWLKDQTIDFIMFGDCGKSSSFTYQLLAVFGDTSVPVLYAPDWYQASMRFNLSFIGFLPCIEIWGAERSLFDRQAKRFFDIILSFLALLILSPLLIVIAFVVAMSSSGPVLFKQKRYGLNGQCFDIIKFRTMYHVLDGSRDDVPQAVRHDTRVTPVGRWLRRWSLDELPQLWNVLTGQMSLVGPRPHAVAHNEIYRHLIPGYMQRHGFKPGITGLAQIEGLRGETRDLEEMSLRVNADLRYQRDWSIIGDCKIILLTLFKLASPKAY